MKKLLSLLMLLVVTIVVNSQVLKPYILGATFNGEVSEAKFMVKNGLVIAGFGIAGEYMPAGDNNRWVIVVSHPSLNKAIQAVGGLTGFAATLRVGITKEGGVVNITYTNPEYWGNAYFRSDYDKVAGDYSKVKGDFKKAMTGIGIEKGTEFGSKKGLSVKNLRKYHYMFGMPYFDDTIDLREFDSHQKAVSKIDNSLKAGKPGVKLVYKYSVPGKDLTLYGIAFDGEKGESYFLPNIDLSTPGHTAFLPYEILVNGNDVIMLHGRFRIAVSFPDLTMGTPLLR